MNPYEKLAQQIQEWDSIKVGNPAKRRLTEQRGLARWDKVRAAFAWLVEVDRLSRHSPKREPLLEALWTYMVHPDKSWQNNENRTSPLAPSNLSHLHTLAEVHTLDPDDAQTLSSQDIVFLRETMELIKSDLIRHAAALGRAGERLLRLVDDCLALLDEPDFDDAAARSKAEQILGAALPASVNIEDPKEQEGFLRNAANAVAVFTRDVAVGVSGSVAGQLFMRMITGG